MRGLGEPFERIFDAHYPQLSWYSHAGVVGLGNATTSSVALGAGICFAIACDAYIALLEIVINEFKLYATMPMLKDKIAYMKEVAFTESQQEADDLLAAYG